LIRYGLYGELPNEDSDVWLFGFDGVIATINSAKANRAKKIDIPKEQLEEMIEQGKTQEEIARAFGCSVDTIQRREKEYCLGKYKKNKVNF
jgi:DNA invertase Pin-like site-specific DNA recombinase